MKKYIIQLLILIPLLTNGQEIIIGKIIDAKNKELIPYATIVLENTLIGTMANNYGYFELNIPDTISRTHKIIITSLGYDSEMIDIDNITDTIYLNQKYYDLPEIIIKNRKAETKLIGVKKNAQQTGSYGTCAQFNLQAALYIPNENQLISWIKSISYYIKKDRGVPNTPFRVRVFEKNDTLNQPGRDLLNQSIIIQGNNNGGWVTANLDSLHIPFGKNGVFVGMEWLYDKTKYHYNSTYKSGTMDCFGQSISITNAISEHRTWMRDLFHNEWRLRDWWYSDRKKTKPSNIMIRIETEYYK